MGWLVNGVIVHTPGWLCNIVITHGHLNDCVMSLLHMHLDNCVISLLHTHTHLDACAMTLYNTHPTTLADKSEGSARTKKKKKNFGGPVWAPQKKKDILRSSIGTSK